MLNGNDVLDVLPTGFGKSMIFTVFSFAKRELLKRTGQAEAVSVLIVSPLKSLIEDQTRMELHSSSCSAEDQKCENLPQIAVSSAIYILHRRKGDRQRLPRAFERQHGVSVLVERGESRLRRGEWRLQRGESRLQRGE